MNIGVLELSLWVKMRNQSNRAKPVNQTILQQISNVNTFGQIDQLKNVAKNKNAITKQPNETLIFVLVR